MKNFFLCLLAVLVGLLIGGLVNMSLVEIGHKLVAVPAGVNLANMEGWREALPKLTPIHFLFPFLAHALGTLAGATIAARIAPVWKNAVAWIVGGCFLGGGIAAAILIPAPTWFLLVDLIVAYLPMAWLGRRCVRG